MPRLLFLQKAFSTKLFSLTVVLLLKKHAYAENQKDPRGSAGLRADLERIISAYESTDWFVDRTEFTAIYPTALQSVCRASSAAREEVFRALVEEQERLGDAKALYEQAGRQHTKQVRRALRISRTRAVFAMALEGVPTDCPFWVEPRIGFDGRQTDRNRFTLNVETGGLLQFRQTEGTWTYGGGGLVRLLPGYGLGGAVTILTGLEFGTGAMLKPKTVPSQFVVNYFPALPLVIRLHDANWYYDIEGAAVSVFQADDSRFSYGVRAGFGMGLYALRTESILPWAGFAVAYEHYFAGGGRAPAEFLQAGLRIGFAWDP